jgi:hypothetical protein
MLIQSEHILPKTDERQSIGSYLITDDELDPSHNLFLSPDAESFWKRRFNGGYINAENCSSCQINAGYSRAGA